MFQVGLMVRINQMEKFLHLQVSTGILVKQIQQIEQKQQIKQNQYKTQQLIHHFLTSGNPVIHENATRPSIMSPKAAYLYPTDDITIY